MSILSSHLTNAQINKCFNDLVNSSQQHCCVSLLQALHNVDVCPSDIEDSTSESETSDAPTQPTPAAEEQAPHQSHIIQYDKVSPSQPEGTTTSPPQQPSPGIEQLLPFQSLNRRESTLTQSEPTQITDNVDFCPSDPQPSHDLDQLLSCQTMTLDENILTIQSQPTQITDTQAVAFDNLDPLTDSTTYQSHPHTSTDTQIASPSFSLTSSPQTMQPPLP